MMSFGIKKMVAWKYRCGTFGLPLYVGWGKSGKDTWLFRFCFLWFAFDWNRVVKEKGQVAEADNAVDCKSKDAGSIPALPSTLLCGACQQWGDDPLLAINPEGVEY